MRYQAAPHSVIQIILAMTSEIKAGENLRAFCSTSEATSGFSDRLQVAMVKITDFDAFCKAHAIAEPIKSVGQNDFSLCACRETVYFNNQGDGVTHLQVDLALMGRCECMGFPRGCHECKGYTLRPVKTIIETLEGNKVKVSVEIDEVEFDRNIDQAFRKIAQEVRIPGFRQGKAPRHCHIALVAARWD